MTTTQVDELRERVTEAYAELAFAVRDAFAAETLLIDAQTDNSRARAAIILAHAADPKQLGSNEAAREAKLADLTSESGSLVRLRETESRDYRHRLELARLRVESVRAQLRLAELAVGIVRNF